MCKLKSCIVLKDQVYCPDHDNYDKMLDELGIKDTQRNAKTRFVRVELSPVDGDIFSSVDKWEFSVDQNFLPDWFVEEIDRPRVVDTVKKWAESHIFVGKNNFELTAGGTYYLKNCKDVTAGNNSQVIAYNNSYVTALGYSQVTVWDNGRVVAYNNSQVTAWEDSRVVAYDNSYIVAHDNSQVAACDNSHVIAYSNCVYRKL